MLTSADVYGSAGNVGMLLPTETTDRDRFNHEEKDCNSTFVSLFLPSLLYLPVLRLHLRLEQQHKIKKKKDEESAENTSSSNYFRVTLEKKCTSSFTEMSRSSSKSSHISSLLRQRTRTTTTSKRDVCVCRLPSPSFFFSRKNLV